MTGPHLSRQELADLRHQLRTPLNHIIGYSEMLLEDLESGLQAGRLHTLLTNAHRILEMVQRTLLPRETGAGDEEMASLRAQMTDPLFDIVRSVGALAHEADERYVADVLRISTAASELMSFVQGEQVRRSLSVDLPPASAEPPAPGHGRLLVVDDDEANRDILSRHLLRHGYSVVTAEEGVQALDLLRKQRFDLVLLDFMMPGMNGYQVLERIRADEALRHIPVVMVSALDEMEGIARCIERGAEDYLFKPFDPVLLRARLVSTLERKRLSDSERSRTAALELAQEELERANDELGRFAYAASHDLQEPLRMVASYVGLLARRYRGRLDRDADDFIQFAEQGAERMGQLISNLLEYSRVGTRCEDMQEFSTERLLVDVLADLQKIIEDSGARIEATALPSIQGDPVQFERLLQNLIANAIKYRGSSAPVIRIGAKQEGSFYVFSVADNGIGIDDDHKDKIFRPFQRLHGKEIPGTGLGLAICQRIVERSGGKIWVESAPGAGSAFFFTVPCAPTSAAAST